MFILRRGQILRFFDQAEQFLEGIALEGVFSFEQFEEGDAECPDVDESAVDGAGFLGGDEEFGGCIAFGADELARESDFAVGGSLS